VPAAPTRTFPFASHLSLPELNFCFFPRSARELAEHGLLRQPGRSQSPHRLPAEGRPGSHSAELYRDVRWEGVQGKLIRAAFPVTVCDPLSDVDRLVVFLPVGWYRM
jgi:hypothetical protein